MRPAADVSQLKMGAHRQSEHKSKLLLQVLFLLGTSFIQKKKKHKKTCTSRYKKKVTRSTENYYSSIHSNDTFNFAVFSDSDSIATASRRFLLQRELLHARATKLRCSNTDPPHTAHLNINALSLLAFYNNCTIMKHAPASFRQSETV